MVNMIIQAIRGAMLGLWVMNFFIDHSNIGMEKTRVSNNIIQVPGGWKLRAITDQELNGLFKHREGENWVADEEIVENKWCFYLVNLASIDIVVITHAHFVLQRLILTHYSALLINIIIWFKKKGKERKCDSIVSIFLLISQLSLVSLEMWLIYITSLWMLNIILCFLSYEPFLLHYWD
jgi:hypothetical protein